MKPLVPILLTVLVDVLGLAMVLPLLPFYATKFGADGLTVGLLFASFSLCQFVGAPVLGRLSDRVGRKPVLLVSQLGTVLGLLLVATAHRIEWLFIGRMLDGFTAGNLSTAQAYITDVTAKERRTAAFGLMGLCFGFGFLVGPAFAGIVGRRFGLGAPFFVAACLSLLSVVLTATLLPHHPPAPKKLAEGSTPLLSRPGVRQRVLQLVLYVLGFSMLTGGLALFLRAVLGFDVEQTGYVFALSGLVGGLAQGGLRRAAARLGEERLSGYGAVVLALGFGLLSVSRSLTWVLAAVAVCSIGAAVVRPALTTLLTESVEEDERGLVLGVSTSSTSLAQAAGPVAAGALIGAGWLSSYALVAGLMMVLVFASRWLFAPKLL